MDIKWDLRRLTYGIRSAALRRLRGSVLLGHGFAIPTPPSPTLQAPRNASHCFNGGLATSFTFYRYAKKSVVFITNPAHKTTYFLPKNEQ